MFNIYILNDALAFILELVCIIIYGGFGYFIAQEKWMKILFTILFPLILIIVWWLYFSPKADYRLEMPALLIGKLIIMFLAVGMLWYLEDTKKALILAVLIIVHLTLATIWNQV